MWLVVVREPLPDMGYWSGRIWLSAIDALLWPALVALAFKFAPPPAGIVGPFGVSMAVLWAFFRFRRAVWNNHRYRFTTWRVGKIALVLWVIGALMKLSLALFSR